MSGLHFVEEQPESLDLREFSEAPLQPCWDQVKQFLEIKAFLEIEFAGTAPDRLVNRARTNLVRRTKSIADLWISSAPVAIHLTT